MILHIVTRIAPWLLLLSAGLAFAAQSPGQKCETGKNQEAGKYAACLHKAEAKLLKTKGACSVSTATVCYGDEDCPALETCSKDLTKYGIAVQKCEAKFEAKWDKLTLAASDKGDPCPDGLQSGDVSAVIGAHVSAVASGLSGAGFVECGNGIIETGEACDQSDLNGATCASQGFAGGSLRCGAGCTYDTAGCFADRYVDNGDGTISDLATGLMWAKQSDDGSVHDKDQVYTWGDITPPYAPTGSAFSVYLAMLNGGAGADTCFAGYCDWRLPSFEELHGLIVPSESPLQVDPAFDEPCAPGCSVTSCSCSSLALWSATTLAEHPGAALGLVFTNALVTTNGKTGGGGARAVRGGL